MWFRSTYANELAVLSAWLVVFIPWNISRRSSISTPLGEGEFSMLSLQLPLFELQFRDEVAVIGDAGVDVSAELSGTELAGNVFITSGPTSATFYDSTLQYASLLWSVASVALGLALVLSLLLYFREERVEQALPRPPVRVMGALLAVGALGTAGASVLYVFERDVVGVPIPIGVLVIAALAVVLLRTEPVDAETTEHADA